MGYIIGIILFFQVQATHFSAIMFQMSIVFL